MSLDRPVMTAEPAPGPSPRLELVPEVAADGSRPTVPPLDVPGRPPPAPATGDIIPTSLDAPELYLNRELTYLNFCWRVLHEAEDDRVPLLERLKFIAIVSSNIDEVLQK